MNRSVERAAENEATFRSVNETLERKAAELGLSEEQTPYLCECEEEHCTKTIALTHQEYEAVRAHPKRFVMVPGHQEPEDRIIEQAGRFTVIEKLGAEAELVAARDPRSVDD
jgi:hypothetical protein